MYQASTLSALFVCALGFSVSATAQEPTAPVANESSLIHLRYETFNPLTGEPAVPAFLRSEGAERLWIVQFAGTPGQENRDTLVASGAQVHGYLPDNSYVVRMPQSAVGPVSALPAIRWVGRYHAAYRLDPVLSTALQGGDLEAARYNMIVVDKHNDKPALAAKIQGLGGVVDNEHQGSILFSATLTGAQLQKVAHLDEVLWIDAWSPAEEDVDNARIQGGANYVESQAGYSGATLNLHIYEGIDTNHPAFSGPVIPVNSSSASTGHGTNTAGIVFGDGTGNPQFRGFAPDCGKFFTNYSSVSTSRWQVFSDLVNIHDVSHTTASWGDARTYFYTSISAEADDIIFDHDLAWTQSQSNAGNQDSRPQAWAKNIFSVGGVRHGDNSNPLDDTWSGSGSTGPAADGRIKPTLAAYYDGIGTTSQGGGYTTSFGGTSGATPIIAGHNALAIEMFTDAITPGVGPFGNALRNPGGSAHSNRPHFTTLKCLQVASARQYAFTSTSTDNRREHVGWGFPNLQTMWDERGKTYVVDETRLLTNGTADRFDVTVASGEAALRVVLNYSEPAGNPAATKTLINDLTVRVTSPGSTVYWGNNALEDGNWSVAGGTADDTNPIECVFVQNPQAGVWHVDIIASAVVADNHVETVPVDADYGLVIVGGQTVPGIPPVFATFSKYGQGCPGSVPLPATCAQVNPNGGNLSNSTNQYEYTFEVPSIGNAQVTSFDIYTRSNVGAGLILPAFIYAQSGSGPSTTPLATTTISLDAAAGFYTATFGPPVTVSGTFYVGFSGPNNSIISNLSSGANGTGYYRTPVSGSWTQSSLVQRPSYRVYCSGGQQFATPVLGNSGLPILTSSYDVLLSDAVAASPAFILTGLSDTLYQTTSLPAPIPGAPGCTVQAAPDVTLLTLTSASGTASATFSVPSSASFVGLNLYHQWAVLDAVNAVGIVVSDAGKASIGN